MPASAKVWSRTGSSGNTETSSSLHHLFRSTDQITQVAITCSLKAQGLDEASRYAALGLSQARYLLCNRQKETWELRLQGMKRWVDHFLAGHLEVTGISNSPLGQ